MHLGSTAGEVCDTRRRPKWVSTAAPPDPSLLGGHQLHSQGHNTITSYLTRAVLRIYMHYPFNSLITIGSRFYHDHIPLIKEETEASRLTHC